MIQCTTQPYPFAEEGRSSGWMRVMVTINGTQYDSNRNYIYHWSYTPRVSTHSVLHCLALYDNTVYTSGLFYIVVFT